MRRDKLSAWLGQEAASPPDAGWVSCSSGSPPGPGRGRGRSQWWQRGRGRGAGAGTPPPLRPPSTATRHSGGRPPELPLKRDEGELEVRAWTRSVTPSDAAWQLGSYDVELWGVTPDGMLQWWSCRLQGCSTRIGPTFTLSTWQVSNIIHSVDTVDTGHWPRLPHFYVSQSQYSVATADTQVWPWDQYWWCRRNNGEGVNTQLFSTLLSCCSGILCLGTRDEGGPRSRCLLVFSNFDINVKQYSK